MRLVNISIDISVERVRTVSVLLCGLITAIPFVSSPKRSARDTAVLVREWAVLTRPLYSVKVAAHRRACRDAKLSRWTGRSVLIACWKS